MKMSRQVNFTSGSIGTGSRDYSFMVPGIPRSTLKALKRVKFSQWRYQGGISIRGSASTCPPPPPVKRKNCENRAFSANFWILPPPPHTHTFFPPRCSPKRKNLVLPLVKFSHRVNEISLFCFTTPPPIARGLIFPYIMQHNFAPSLLLPETPASPASIRVSISGCIWSVICVSSKFKCNCDIARIKCSGK